MNRSDIWDRLSAPPPTIVNVHGVSIGVGARVRLHPRDGGDVMDLVLAGRTAVVEGIDVTTEDEPHFAVTIDDDPGRDLGAQHYLGHRFFFRADEIALLDESTPALPARRPSVLIAGIGNIFFGDDAFGVAVVRHLADASFPDGVTVTDFGIRGLDLAYALVDGYDAAILIDAAARGGTPGTIYVIEPELSSDDAGDGAALNAHGMDPVRVLRLAQTLGRLPARLTVIGCEPARVGDDGSFADSLVSLSAGVAAAVPEAARLVTSLVHTLTAPTTP